TGCTSENQLFSKECPTGCERRETVNRTMKLIEQSVEDRRTDLRYTTVVGMCSMVMQQVANTEEPSG
ncbi:MAG: hypothetical protein ABIH46_01185, partial [Chloroflexota bacterium]